MLVDEARKMGKASRFQHRRVPSPIKVKHLPGPSKAAWIITPKLSNMVKTLVIPHPRTGSEPRRLKAVGCTKTGTESNIGRLHEKADRKEKANPVDKSKSEALKLQVTRLEDALKFSNPRLRERALTKTLEEIKKIAEKKRQKLKRRLEWRVESLEQAVNEARSKLEETKKQLEDSQQEAVLLKAKLYDLMIEKEKWDRSGPTNESGTNSDDDAIQQRGVSSVKRSEDTPPRNRDWSCTRKIVDDKEVITFNKGLMEYLNKLVEEEVKRQREHQRRIVEQTPTESSLPEYRFYFSFYNYLKILMRESFGEEYLRTHGKTLLTVQKSRNKIVMSLSERDHVTEAAFNSWSGLLSIDPAKWTSKTLSGAISRQITEVFVKSSKSNRHMKKATGT